jgi:hypothetical protein
MIRREMTSPDGDKQWALISQVEHAHLAAGLARQWRDPLLPASGQSRPAAAAAGCELLEAIEHHDDGWAEWEEAPGIDPEHGRPRSFLEMPQIGSLAIWSKSIAVAEQIGPLAAWVVAGHFSALLKVGGSDAPSEEAKLAAEWHGLMQSRRGAWLQEWLGVAPAVGQETAEYGLRALQFFDAASLWFCCACPPEDQPPASDGKESALTFSDGNAFRFTTSASNSGPPPDRSIATIHPWPLADRELQLTVACRIAPVQRYLTADELFQEWQPRRLTWRLHETPARRA